MISLWLTPRLVGKTGVGDPQAVDRVVAVRAARRSVGRSRPMRQVPHVRDRRGVGRPQDATDRPLRSRENGGRRHVRREAAHHLRTTSAPAARHHLAHDAQSAPEAAHVVRGRRIGDDGASGDAAHPDRAPRPAAAPQSIELVRYVRDVAREVASHAVGAVPPGVPSGRSRAPGTWAFATKSGDFVVRVAPSHMHRLAGSRPATPGWHWRVLPDGFKGMRSRSSSAGVQNSRSPLRTIACRAQAHGRHRHRRPQTSTAHVRRGASTSRASTSLSGVAPCASASASRRRVGGLFVAVRTILGRQRPRPVQPARCGGSGGARGRARRRLRHEQDFRPATAGSVGATPSRASISSVRASARPTRHRRAATVGDAPLVPRRAHAPADRAVDRRAAADHPSLEVRDRRRAEHDRRSHVAVEPGHRAEGAEREVLGTYQRSGSRRRSRRLERNAVRARRCCLRDRCRRRSRSALRTSAERTVAPSRWLTTRRSRPALRGPCDALHARVVK